jgi:tetratricopeptide (TPR) repeat protein
MDIFFVMTHRTSTLAAQGALAALLTVLLVAGCSSSGGSGAAVPPPDPRAREAALQHVIAGSVHEAKGEYAEAVLEYQDALRFEPDAAVYYALGKCYGALGKHALAVEAAREAVRRSPSTVEYRRTLAEIYAAAMELDSAAAQYEEIVRLDSRSVESWYNLARLYQGRKPLRALEVYTSIIEQFGPEWDVLLQIAELQDALGRPDKAAEALESMLLIDPGNQQLRQSLAGAYVRAERTDTALAILEGLRALNPDNTDYTGDIAGIYLRRKEYARAAQEFDALLSRDSLGIEGKLRVGELYFSRLEEDSTLLPVTRTLFLRIRDAHPDDWRPWWFLGGIAGLAGEDSAAEAGFRKVTELAPWNADGWVYLATLFLRREEYDQARDVLEAAVAAVPGEFRVHFFLGVACSRLDRNIEAAAALEQARSLNPADVNAVIQLAIAYEALDRIEDTDRLYEEALRMDPENHLVLNNFAYSLAERNVRIADAYAMARKAVAAQDTNASYLDTLGWVYFRMGRYDEAEQYVRQAIARGDASAVLYEHLGDIYAMMGDRERAMREWTTALELDGANEDLRRKIGGDGH